MIKNVFKDESGAAITEYLLLLCLIALAAFAVINTFGSQIEELFMKSTLKLQNKLSNQYKKDEFTNELSNLSGGIAGCILFEKQPDYQYSLRLNKVVEKDSAEYVVFDILPDATGKFFIIKVPLDVYNLELSSSSHLFYNKISNVRIAPDSLSLVSFYLINNNNRIINRPSTVVWGETDSTLVSLELFINKGNFFRLRCF